MSETPSARLRLPRSTRIKSTGDFARTRAKGGRFTSGCLILNIAERPLGLQSRVGVVTSRKIGNAVIRSRARRLLRETFRLHQHELARPVDLILVARNSIVGKNFANVERDFLKALAQSQFAKK
jgi:ribonuclease P protein component